MRNCRYRRPVRRKFFDRAIWVQSYLGIDGPWSQEGVAAQTAEGVSPGRLREGGFVEIGSHALIGSPGGVADGRNQVVDRRSDGLG